MRKVGGQGSTDENISLFRSVRFLEFNSLFLLTDPRFFRYLVEKRNIFAGRVSSPTFRSAV